MIKTLQALAVTALILLATWAVESFLDKARPQTPVAVRLLIFMLSMRAISAHTA